MKKSIINLGGNIYDTDGNLRRKAPIKPVTIPELEQMIDECPAEGYPGSPNAKWNMLKVLTHLYNTKGNPYEKELKDRLKSAAMSVTDNEEIKEKLESMFSSAPLEPKETTYNTDTTDDEYVEYEEAA